MTRRSAPAIVRDAARRVRPPWDASRYVVSIRPIETTDTEALLAFYAGLSSESRQGRFLGSRAAPTLHQCQRFAELGEGGFVAVLCGSGPCDGDVIGHLSLDPLDEGREEITVAVTDEYQHRHIASNLLWAAVHSARRRGVRELRGVFFLGNEPLLRLLRHLSGARFLAAADGIAECLIAVRPIGA